MMNSLYIARSGLDASKYSVDVTSNNIANQNTEGYIKRVVNTSEINYANSNEVGSGVSFDGVTRTTSDYLYDKLISQNSLASYYSQQDSVLSGLETTFSETDSAGLSTTLSNFFSSLETLRSSSSSLVNQNDFSTQAQTLVDNLKSLNNSIDETFSSTQKELQTQVDSVNNILKQIVSLNDNIFKNGASSSNDLLDKRDSLEKELSNYANIEVNNDNGMYNLKVAGVSVIFNNTNLDEITIDGDFSDLNNLNTNLKVYNENLNLTSGSLKSLKNQLTTSTSDISSYKQSLNDFAKAIVDYTSSNSSTPIFSGTDVDSLSFDKSKVSSLTSSDLDNLSNLQWSSSLTIGTTTKTSFSDFYQNLLSTVSSNVSINSSKLDSQNSIVNSLQTSYDNLTKVDPDTEMINLMQYQSAYEANAKIITAVDEMLQKLLAM